MIRLDMRPTLVVVKAFWCHHCTSMTDTLKKVAALLKNTGMNMIVIELDAFNTHKSDVVKSRTLAELHRQGVTGNGVPYIGMTIPPRRKEDPNRGMALVNFQGSRDPESITRFISRNLSASEPQPRRPTGTMLARARGIN